MLLSLFFVFLVLLLITVFKINVSVVTNGLELKTKIQVGVGPVSLTIPQFVVAKITEIMQRGGFESLDQVWGRLQTALRMSDSFLQKIDLFELQVVVGTGDPFLSALGCGGIWALLGPFLTGLSMGNRLTRGPEISIQPDHSAPAFQVNFHCIFRFRLGQIIVNELKRVTS